MDDTTKVKKTIDCIGLYCPQPLFQAREGMDSIEVGEVIEVLADDPAAEEDIKRFAKRTGHEIIALEKDGSRLRFLIKKAK
ncbi:MAG: sulfurtransferase TusA family protein [candidate division WOR-3 bacterium]|jgi:TusA-related sulfurtransferase